MLVVNRKKDDAKNFIISNISNNIINIRIYSCEIKDLVSNINYIIGGLPSQTDIRLTGCCQRALNNLSQSSRFLQNALQNAKNLIVVEVVDDDHKLSKNSE